MRVSNPENESLIVMNQRTTLSDVVAALRPLQWGKNLLVFVPLVTSHRLLERPLILTVLLAFVCFCLTASAAYVLNDLLDLAADRLHPAKRHRPIARGAMPLSWVRPLVVGLLAVAFGLSGTMLPWSFSAVLATYFVATCIYSLGAKRVAMLDVLFLAGLYVIRVFGGGEAVDIPVSEWLMAFSLFLFVSLAFAKRCAELERLSRNGDTATLGRGYRVADLGLVESMGVVSGYLSALVLALYVNSAPMQALYRRSWPLWLMCPVLLYWISRLWLLAKRGELQEDPVLFVFRDRMSLFLGAAMISLLVVATL